MKYLRLAMLLILTGCAAAPAKDKAAKSLSAEVPAVPRMSSTVTGYTLGEYAGRTCPTKTAEDATLKEYLKAASACLSHGQWALVETLANKMAVHFSSDPWGAYFLSLSAEHAKDWPRARWMAELAVKKTPEEGVALYQLGRVQWEMGEQRTAFVTIKKASEKNPTLVEAHVLAGQLALLNDSNSDALKFFQQALDHDSKHFEALIGMAEAEIRKGLWQSADEHLRTAIQLKPRDTHARLMWAQGMEFVARDSSAALEIYRTIQRLDKDHKLDSALPLDVAAKVQMLQVNVAEELKKKQAARTPSADTKDSKGVSK